MNTQTEKGMTGSIKLRPQEVYSVEANVLHKKSAKRNSQLKIVPTLSIRTPTAELLSLVGNVDFKNNKSLKTNIQVNMATYLRDTLSLTCRFHAVNGSTVALLRYSVVLFYTLKYSTRSSVLKSL